jgi:hypothetical protein
VIRSAPDTPTLPPHSDAAPPVDAAPDAIVDDGPSESDRPRARSISGEIRVPVRRAPSIRPPLPEPEPEPQPEPASEPEPADEDDDEPVIVIERGSDDEATGPRVMPPRRRAVKSDPPELRARAGEVDLKETGDRSIVDEPRIVVDEDALAPQTARIDRRATHPDDTPPLTTIEVADDADTGAVIHDRIVDRASEAESQPILLDRPRATPDPLHGQAPASEDVDDDDDTGETDIVILETKKPKSRVERHTQVGVPPPVAARTRMDAVPATVDRELEHTEENDDPTKIDLRAAPPGEDTTSDQLAAPPGPASEHDTNPYVIAAPPQPAPPRAAPAPRAVIVDDDDGDDDEPQGPHTSEMTAAELDDAIPERTTEIDLGHPARRRIEYDPTDDGWGPPGTTIPPPLLGAIPGIDDDDEDGYAIPMSNVDSSPLLVGPPTVPPGHEAGQALVRTLEEATARAIEVIRELEHANSRDEVVGVLVAYLVETHHRAGFFVTRHGPAKGVTELGVFSMLPRPAMLPFATLRLDRPSTLQDVVGTRLPYRGPMHDDTSRGFLISVLGACPAEILLVPVAVRERVVGVLFGEHRKRHTFDDQLALAARAAGMALERILRARRT